MGNRFLRGAMILSISMFATKFLGILYVIPFQNMVGASGMALYNYAYVPYSLFISLSTLGIPVGIAKFVSKYNAEGEYDTARGMFRYGIYFIIMPMSRTHYLSVYLLLEFQLGLQNLYQNIMQKVNMIRHGECLDMESISWLPLG